MKTSVSSILLWLFVLNLGIAFGAGAFEHRIVVPRWLGQANGGEVRWDAAAARADDVGLRFWVFVTTVPLTLLTLASLVAAARASGPVRVWWLAAALLALADRALTFSYFIPTMVGLMRAVEVAGSSAVAARWDTLNHLRHVLVLAAWLCAMKAFALFHQQRA